MPILAVQLNHPGAEKPFKIGNGFVKKDGKLYREWNKDATHYRKFIEQDGAYLDYNSNKPLPDILHFWGEWEGVSEYLPSNAYNPNGIHQPIHDISERGTQNTDPYVFGDCFLYAVCKQRGQLNNLDSGSLILFGSSFKSGFALDTVFVVKKSTSVHEVARTITTCVSRTYREATLEQLGDTYIKPHSDSLLRLYESYTYKDNQTYFSYVPCIPKSNYDGNGFKRLTVPFNYSDKLKLSSNPTGWKILGLGEKSCFDIYSSINMLLESSGLYKGIQLTEPE